MLPAYAYDFTPTLRYLPLKIYGNSLFMQSVCSALDAENALLKEKMQEVFAQWFVATATYTLEEYEYEYGIIPKPALGAAVRKAEIRARRRMITSSAYDAILAYCADLGAINTEITFIPATNTIKVLISGELSLITSFSDDVISYLHKFIREAVPSHLGLIILLGTVISGVANTYGVVVPTTFSRYTVAVY